MKRVLTIIIDGLLVLSGFGQSRQISGRYPCGLSLD
jgi:hypothetical protein